MKLEEKKLNEPQKQPLLIADVSKRKLFFSQYIINH
jgi:hypothetical protein